MKEALISKLNKLIVEYENNSHDYIDLSTSMSEYYGGKAEALREVLELINEME